MPMTTASDPYQLDWLLQRLLDDTPHIRHALLVASDGIRICHTEGLSVEKADRLSAIASGIQALAVGACADFGTGVGGVRQSMTEFNGGILFVVGTGPGTQLAVLADEEADAGLVGAQMAALVEKVGEHLAVPSRIGRVSSS